MQTNSTTNLLEQNSGNYRIEYIDALRGFCMMSVVFCHLQVNGLAGYDFVNTFLESARESLFMFISGFLSYSIAKPPISKIKNRFLNLFLPTIVTGGIFTTFMNHLPVMSALRHATKSGYWFTWVLFEIYALYALATWLADKISQRLRLAFYIILMILSPILLWLFNHMFDEQILKSDWYLIPSMGMILSIFPFFLMGVVAKIFKDTFFKLISNKKMTSIVLPIYLLACYFHSSLGYMGSLYTLGTLGILFFFALFFQYQELFSSNHRIGRYLSYAGKKSLHIYFLHYFVIFGIQEGAILPFLRQYTDCLIGLPAYILITCLITTICLGIEHVIKNMAPYLHTIMFGAER